jgi:TPR repeat protein
VSPTSLNKFILHRLPEPKDADQSWQLGVEAIARADQETALRMFSRAAEDGEWYAHYALGYLNVAPLSGEAPNFEVGLRHLEIAARSNQPLVVLALAVALIKTNGDIERKRAFSIITDNAERGDPLSKIYLGYLLNEGRAAPKDELKAEQLWLEAADANWVWPMQLLTAEAKRKRRYREFLKWKWRTFKTAVSLANNDPDDIRLVNAV